MSICKSQRTFTNTFVQRLHYPMLLTQGLSSVLLANSHSVIFTNLLLDWQTLRQKQKLSDVPLLPPNMTTLQTRILILKGSFLHVKFQKENADKGLCIKSHHTGCCSSIYKYKSLHIQNNCSLVYLAALSKHTQSRPQVEQDWTTCLSNKPHC